MIPANVIIQMYVVFHPEFVVQVGFALEIARLPHLTSHPQLWHIFLVFVLINWSCCLTVVFFNRFMPVLQKFGLFMLVVGGVVTIIVCVFSSCMPVYSRLPLKIGSRVRQNPRICLFCLPRLGKRDRLAWRGRISDGYVKRRIRNRDTRLGDAHGRRAAPS